MAINEMANANTISGLTLIPEVSSSKNLRSPAPVAGMGASLRLLLALLLLISSPHFRDAS